MKRLLMTLFIGLALVACSNTKTTTPNNNSTNQNNTTQTETNKNNGTTNGTTAATQVKYIEDLGFKDVKNVNDTNYHQTYKLNETTAVDENIYGQWIYTWAEPSEYVGKDIDVYRYTATKDNKNYDVYVMADRNNNTLGGYYYEQGQTMADAKILDTKYEPRIVEDFKSTWNKLFNINHTNTNTTTGTQTH